MAGQGVPHRAGELPAAAAVTLERLRSRYGRPVQRRRDQRGVVISELILVLVVVAGLLAVIVYSVKGIRSDATSADCRTELRKLKVATEQYFAETGSYPFGTGALVDKGLLGADEVPNYRVEPSADAEATVPVFRASGDCA